MRCIVYGHDGSGARVMLGLRDKGWSVTAGNAPTDACLLLEPANCPLVVVGGAPGSDILSVVTSWRRAGMRRPVLAIAGHGELDEVSLLEAGADDWLPLLHDITRLDARLRALMRRVFRQGEALSVGPILLDWTTRQATVHGEVCALGQRQFSLLWLLAERQGQVVRAAEILAAWRLNASHENLVEVQVSQLRKKLGAASARLQTVRGRGYSLSDTGRIAG